MHIRDLMTDIDAVSWEALLICRGVLLDVRPYQLGCGASGHLPSAGGQSPNVPLPPAAPLVEAPAVSCRAAAQPAAKSPTEVLGSRQQQHEPAHATALPQRLGASHGGSHQTPLTAARPPPAATTPPEQTPKQSRQSSATSERTPEAAPQQPWPHEAAAKLMTPNLLYSPSSAASAAAAATSPARQQEDEDADRQPGCGEHWRRALGNITNRRGPRGKRRDSKQQPAPPQPELFTPLASGAASQLNNSPSTVGRGSYSLLPAAPHAQALAAQQTAFPEPEKWRAAAARSQPLQPVLHSREEMTPGSRMHLSRASRSIQC